MWDGGAYSDKAIDLTRAGAVDCTGPYNIENLWCDSYCMYTNHPYPAPFRGFSHSELSFAIERTLDLLAQKLQIDPLELRYRNAIKPGNTTPTRVLLNHSNVGNLQKCIERLRELIRWDEGQIKEVNDRLVRVKGISCSWKTSTIDPNAPSGVILTFNRDGSINLMSGVVEIGTGTKTVLAQILAEKLKMDVDKIHVRMTVDTQTTPEHWKTVASRGIYMAGNAVLEAADDVIGQLKEIASIVLRAPIEDLEVAHSRVFLKDNPKVGLPFKDIGYGYQYPNGNSIGGQIIGRGNFILRHLTHLDPETGAGKPGPEWTVAAYGVEVEFDRRDYTYRLRKAATVVDIGIVLNRKAALGQVMGAMSMGLAFAGRETFYFDELGRVLNPQLRTYRPLRYGENPEYLVDFVYTPDLQAAIWSARGWGTWTPRNAWCTRECPIGRSRCFASSSSINSGVNLENKGRGKVMLHFDFDYYQPETWKEAVELFQSENQKGKKPMFISGGTELITLGRIDLAYTEAAIDLKNIAESNGMVFQRDYLLLGSSLTLTAIEEANPFPLLTATASEVADHSARGKITLGGNICAQIFYREAVLPFLLS